MKAKAKAGGKSKVTFDVRKPPEMPFKPFRFEKWTDDDLKPPLVTMESKIAEFLETARRESEMSAEDKREGKADYARNLARMAKASRAKAAKWRKLSSLPKAEDERLDWRCYQELAEGVDLLAARGQTSNEAKFWLSCIIGQAAQGLLALAAHGDGVAATKLIDSLVLSVRRFECLASHRPDCFTHYTRRLALIPATISPQSGNAEECRELMDNLEVGAKSIFSVRGTGKRWKQATPVNDLALRLVGYIDDNRRFHRFSFGCHPELFSHWPQWISEAVRLPDFDAGTCGQWAKVAWKILLEVTMDKPQDDPHLRPIGASAEKKKPRFCKTLHEATKAANVKDKIMRRLFEAFKQVAGIGDSSPGMPSNKGGNGESSVT